MSLCLAGRTMAALLALGLLGACSSRPEPGLMVPESTTGTPGIPLEIFAIATRKPSADPGLRFSGERNDVPQFARLALSIPKNRTIGEIQWPSGEPDPGRHFQLRAFEPLDRPGFTKRLRNRLAAQPDRHVLLFVHGYNTRFDEATFRFAQIVQDSGAAVTPVLFSWASWGSARAYPYDRESAALARDGLEAALDALAASPEVAQVTVLAHSMGGWLTLETLRQMVVRRKGINPKIRDVMLASPDVDIDVARAHATILRSARTRPSIVLFTSTDDKALSASRWLLGSKARLGAINPTQEPYRSGLERAGVMVVDLSGVSSDDPLNHGKFAQSPAIVQLIGRRLAAGQELNPRDGIENPVAAIIGGTTRAAELIVTIPTQISEPLPPGGVLVE